MNALDAWAVARLLTELGQRIELTGDSPFKARAYYKAAENLQTLSVPLAQLIQENKLRTIPGVGEAIAEKILKLHATGTHPTLERLREEYPAGLLDMLRIPGLGTKKILLIFQTLKLSTIAELEEACRQGRLKDCKGLGERLEAKILKGIEFVKKGAGLLLLGDAEDRLHALCQHLAQTHPQWRNLIYTGAARRGCELVSELAIVAQTVAPAAPAERCWQSASFEQLQVHLADEDHYGLALLWTTGSAAHLQALQAFAASKGLSLDERGLWQGTRPLRCPTESAIYGALGLALIEPELREGLGEIELAATGKLPRLVNAQDIKGILHSHTLFSDGLQSVREMAEEVRARGYQYFGVADHSQTAVYAGGLAVKDVHEQMKLIAGLNQEIGGGFRIFSGIESDIREDGRLDYDDEILSGFDCIIASVHSRFNLDKTAQTERILRAVRNPFTTILGHMTGRLLLEREEYHIDIERILAACAENRVVVEINCNPHRLDLDWRWHRKAVELGCLLSINPDAHSTAELDFVRLGVRIARKGGLSPHNLLNCMTLPEIMAFFEARKTRRPN